MNDKRIIVTGGFGALGSAVVQLALSRGAKAARVDFAHADPAPAFEAVTLGGVDLTVAARAEAAIQYAQDELGGLDALVNVAGGFRWEVLAGGSPDTWLHLYATNVLTAANASRAAAPHLARSTAGRIVNVGANAAVKGGVGLGAYAAAKAGVHRLTESLAEELRGTGVTVNAVLPSILDTPANRAAMPDADYTKWVAPLALAEVIMFLCSDAAAPINGALLPVVGGL